MANSKGVPLVYSCSGCSSVAQMANHLALQLDREGLAEMSCIAGVGGDVKSLVAKARSGQKIIAIDGCPLNCVRSCLERHKIEPRIHLVLSDYKITKRLHTDFDPTEARGILDVLTKKIEEMEA